MEREQFTKYFGPLVGYQFSVKFCESYFVTGLT